MLELMPELMLGVKLELDPMTHGKMLLTKLATGPLTVTGQVMLTTLMEPNLTFKVLLMQMATL